MSSLYIFITQVWGVDLKESVGPVLQDTVLDASPLLSSCFIDALDLVHISAHHIPDAMRDATHAMINIGIPDGLSIISSPNLFSRCVTVTSGLFYYQVCCRELPVYEVYHGSWQT